MNNKELGSNILITIIYVYLIIGQIMAVYFWWQLAQENSFLYSITIGPFLAEIKGLLWIFFIW